MCMGAIAMSSVRNGRVASRDAWAGGTGLLRQTDYLKKKEVAVVFEDGLVGEIFFYVHMLSQRKGNEIPHDHPFYDVMRRSYPKQFARIGDLEVDKEFARALENADAEALVRRMLELNEVIID